MGLMQRVRSVVFPPAMPMIDNYWPGINFGGYTYPQHGLNQTLQGKSEPIGGDFQGLIQGALRQNGIVFACMLARMSMFSQARFMYRQLRGGTPGDLFSLPALEILRHPWPGGTTSDLLARAIQQADLAGNAFMTIRNGEVAFLRPDWMFIIHGSLNDATLDMWDPDATVIGYAYVPGGMGSGRAPMLFEASEVAHFAPYPDPLGPNRGMSWLTPLLREIEADTAATSHKLAFFVNGATPNLVVTGVPSGTEEMFRKWVDQFEGKHRGVANAYRSLYLSPSMDAKVVGSNLEQLDFKVTQGAGETRIAAAAGVPAVVVGISEGLQGSSLNSGNYQASMRRFADMTIRPAWANMCGSLANIIPVPQAAELWYDDEDIPALKDDIRSAAEVRQLNSQAIRALVDTGFTADSVVAAITSDDFKRLVHTGLFSVQLQAPGSTKMPVGEVPGELPAGGVPGQTKPETIPAGDVSTKPTSAAGALPASKPPGRDVADALEPLLTRED